MEGVLALIALVWSILSIILFFKVWNMCNNVQRITEILEDKSKNRMDNISQERNNKQDKKTKPESRPNNTHECNVKVFNPWK